MVYVWLFSDFHRYFQMLKSAFITEEENNFVKQMTTTGFVVKKKSVENLNKEVKFCFSFQPSNVTVYLPHMLFISLICKSFLSKAQCKCSVSRPLQTHTPLFFSLSVNQFGYIFEDFYLKQQ